MHTPRHIFVDLSTACNATCIMCATQLNPHRKKVMSDALFTKIVTEVSSFAPQIDGFYLGVHGEPFIDKKLEQKVALCYQHGIRRTIVATNGALVDERRAAALLEGTPWIVIFSLESMTPAIFEKIRVGLSHAEVVANIKRFIDLRNRMNSPTRVAVRFIESDWNSAEKEEYVAYWTPFLDTTGRFDYVETHPIHNWGYGDSTKFYGTTPCPHIEHMTILSDGTVSACCLDHDAVYNLGNVSSQHLLEIFDGPAASEFRAIHLAGKRNTLTMCSTCNVAEFWADRTTIPIERETQFVAADWIDTSKTLAHKVARA